MQKYLVIFFVWMLALPVFAQQQEPSYEWFQAMKEVIKTSPQMKFTQSKATKLGDVNRVSDDLWRAIIFNSNFVGQGQLSGAFELLDLTHGTLAQVSDTTLVVSVSNLSVAWEIQDGVNVDEDKRFLLPTYEVGTMKIIKSYTSPEKGNDVEGADQNVLAEELSVDPAQQEKSLNADLSDDSTNVTWMVEDKMFTVELNGKDYVYALNPENGKWESQDPDAPKVIKAGDRKSDPSFVFDKHGNLVASNKRNGYKFGMGDYAGYSNNYYRNALNGRPLGGGYGLMPVSSAAFYPSYGVPFYGNTGFGGGWNTGFGGGCFGGGFSTGLSLDFGWTTGGSYVNPYYCMPNRYSSGGAAIWNGYTHVGIDWVGSGVGWTAGNSGYWYDDGLGGCKSNNATHAYVSVDNNTDYVEASGNAKSLSVGGQQEEETFVSIGAKQYVPEERATQPTAMEAKADPAKSSNRFEGIQSTTPAKQSVQTESTRRVVSQTDARSEASNRSVDVTPSRKAPVEPRATEQPRTRGNDSFSNSQDVQPGRKNPVMAESGQNTRARNDRSVSTPRTTIQSRSGHTERVSSPSVPQQKPRTASPTTRRNNPSTPVVQPRNNGGGDATRAVRNSGAQNRGSVNRPVRTGSVNRAAVAQPVRSTPVRQANPQVRQQKPMRSAPARAARKGR